jgi:branched-subunit amino acid transport protein
VSAWRAVAVVLVVAVATYAMRAGVILALAGRSIPAPLERALRYVGPSVLAALAINLAASGEGGEVGLSAPEALALVVCGLVAWRSKHVLLTLVASMSTLWVVTAISDRF